MSRLSRKQLAKELWDYIQATPDKSAAIRHIAAFLISEGRVQERELIMRDIEQLRRVNDGVLEVHMTSARPLPKTVSNRLLSLFDAPNKYILTAIDPSLIGGVHVRAQDQVIDLSVRTRLRRLKYTMPSRINANKEL